MDKNNKYSYLKAVGWITQLGLNMVTPILLCTLGAVWLKNTFNTENWIVFVAIILGVAASGLNMFKFIDAVKKQIGGKKHDEEREN